MSNTSLCHARTLLVAAALCLSLLTPAFPRQQTARDEQDEEVVRVNSNLVQVDTVVVDGRGRQVTDLQAADFEIVEEGAPRRPEFCQYVSVEGARAGTPADGRLASNEVRRSTVFVVSSPLLEFKNGYFSDDRPFDAPTSNLLLSMVVADTRAANRLLTKFVDEQMGPHDLAAVRDTEGAPGPFTSLTADRAALKRAIERVQFDPFKRAPKVTVTFTSSGWLVEELIAQNLRVIALLEAAVEQLSRLPGRRVLVLVSRGTLYGMNVKGAERVRARMDELSLKANRAGVTIYTLNPRGPDEANLRGGGMQDNGGLMHLADETGGRAIFNRNDIAAGFEGVVEENRGYYLLGYNPGQEASARPHKIQVRVRRPGLRVQARSTAYARGADPRAPVARPQLTEVLESPLAFRDIRLRLTPLLLSPDGKTARVVSVVNIDLANASREVRADGAEGFNLDVVGRVTAPDGSIIYQQGKNYLVSSKHSAAVPPRGVDYWFELEASAPGFYQLGIAVRDAVSGRVGNITQFFQVPDLARGEFGTSSLFLSEASDEASAVEASRAGGQNLTAYSRGSFPAGGTLRYQLYVYNPKRDKNLDASSLEVRMTLAREGKAQAVTPTRPVTQVGTPVFVGGDIPLEGLPPGRYTLEASVTDKNLRATRTIVSHPFQVTN